MTWKLAELVKKNKIGLRVLDGIPDGGFKYFRILTNIFQMGWNHQLVLA